jgi:hypothetical protein
VNQRTGNTMAKGKRDTMITRTSHGKPNEDLMTEKHFC